MRLETEGGDERASRGRGRRPHVVDTAAPSSDLQIQLNPPEIPLSRPPPEMEKPILKFLCNSEGPE